MGGLVWFYSPYAILLVLSAERSGPGFLWVGTMAQDHSVDCEKGGVLIRVEVVNLGTQRMALCRYGVETGLR